MDNMIYFDHNATTPCHQEVLDTMFPYFIQKFGNASSGFYPLSWQSQIAVKESRENIANMIGAVPDEIIFTSGSTESCYLGIRGLIELFHVAKKEFMPHIISSPMEHSAVLNVIQDMEKMGWCQVSWVRGNEDGIIDIEEVKAARKDNTVLLAIMLANNVTGVIQDIKSLSAWARSEKVVTFCDTTQAIAKMPVSVKELGIDMATISAHKMYGPKGVGCLYLRKGRPSVRIKALLPGGMQENGLRGGTQNVPGIVGFGKACELSAKNIEGYRHLEKLRDELENRLLESPNIYIWGKNALRLPHVSMVGIKGKKGVDILNKLKGKYAFSLGSACQAHENKPSYVLLSMQTESEYIDGSFRISLGIYNTMDEVLSFVDDLKSII